TGGAPAARFLAAGVYDPAGNRMIAFGGFSANATLGDIWELTLGNPPAWRQMAPLGTAPGARRGHSAIYKSTTTPLVIFGGRGGPTDDLLSDTEALTFGPPGPPQITDFLPRGGLAGDDVIIFGDDFAGATDVSFNGVSAPILEISNVRIRTRVPAGATTGPIRVTTSLGSATSTVDFFTGGPPEILSATPDSGRVGAQIKIAGRNL